MSIGFFIIIVPFAQQLPTPLLIFFLSESWKNTAVPGQQPGIFFSQLDGMQWKYKRVDNVALQQVA